MSWVTLQTQALARQTNCLLNNGSAFARKVTLPLCHRARRASSKTGSRPAKATASAAPDVVAVSKKKISTKSTTSATAKSLKSKMEAAAATAKAGDAMDAAPKKNTRSASTKAAPAAPKKKVDTSLGMASKMSTSATATAASTSGKKTPLVTAKSKAAIPPKDAANPASKAQVSPKATASSSRLQAAPAQSTATAAAMPTAAHTGSPPDPQKKPVDVRSPEYKRAARSYTSVMVALPILLVTSYFLFDRFALDNPVKSLEMFHSSPASKEDAKTSDA